MLSPVALKAYAYDTEGHNGFWSVIAYFLGIVFFSGGIIALLTNAIRTMGERYNNGTLNKYAWKNHVLFLGYDDLMIGTLKDACEHNKKLVIAVPSDVPQIRTYLTKYIPEWLEKIEIIQCNQTSKDDLVDKARILRASKIFIIGQADNQTHDAQNMQTLAYIARMWHEKEKEIKDAKVPHIMTYFRNQSTFSLLQRQGFDAVNLWNMVKVTLKKGEDVLPEQAFMNKYCEYFNFHCDKARYLLSEDGGIKPDWHSDKKNLSIEAYADKQVHLFVIGMTEMGVAIVREALRLAHPSGTNTKFLITMVDENAYREMRYFIGRTKELFKRCHYTFKDYDNPTLNFNYSPETDFVDVEFEFIQCNVAHPILNEHLIDCATSGNELLSLVICTNDAPKNMAVAMYLPVEILCGENAVPTWVYQNGDDSMSQLLNEDKYPMLHTFSLSDHIVEDAATSSRFMMARNIATYYDKHYGDKKTPKSWEEIPSSDRWSSIYNVLSMEIKLRTIGIPSIKKKFLIDNDNIKSRIDIIEHNRWIIEKLSCGFVPTDNTQHEKIVQELNELLPKYSKWETDQDARKELERKRKEFKKLKNINIHDDIRSFDELTEYTRRKDRIFLDNYLESMRLQNKD